MKQFITIVLLLISCGVRAQKENHSHSYQEVIQEYKALDSLYEEASMVQYGRTDCGETLRLFIISKDKIFDPVRLRALKKCILFIDNGIHPGEPDGIEASIQLAKDLLSKALYKRLLENVVVCIIPVFNIDGALNRGCCSRSNQNGPDEYGFRANSKNLDLNRDFTKTDARSTKSMINILRQWNPDVFIDTHVSDGADYQYNMTLIPSQHNKMSPVPGEFMKNKLTAELFDKMKDKNDEMTPYVQTIGEKEIPDSGIESFLETPRFLCGYLSLFNTFSFMSESHMLKPFPQRVKSTMNLLTSLLEVCDEEHEKIIELRKKASEEILKDVNYYFNWKCDTTKKETLEFKGYAAVYKPSKVTGLNRLYYDHAQPYRKKISYYDTYYPSDTISIPKYYFIPQGWDDVLRLLEMNGVSFTINNADSSAKVVATYIKSYQTVAEPYEGHYLHHDVKTRNETLTVEIKKGDYIIRLPQKNMRYILETLTPRAVDSYFCWGFFDAFLQQKEGFSDYVYDDIAAELLDKDPSLKKDFTDWKLRNPNADADTQLNFIYQHSPDFEKTYRRYPVFAGY